MAGVAPHSADAPRAPLTFLFACSAVLPWLTPELNVARSRVLDYFEGQDAKSEVFAFEKGNVLGTHTERMICSLCRDLAFSRDQHLIAGHQCDARALLIKNYPEFKCLRNVAL